MSPMTNGSDRGKYCMHGIRPHQAKLVSKISEATVHFSLTNSQTCSWSQKYHLNLKITGFIQVEILESIYYSEVTTFVVYVQPHLVTALDVDESVKTVTVHVEPGSCTTSGS